MNRKPRLFLRGNSLCRCRALHRRNEVRRSLSQLEQHLIIRNSALLPLSGGIVRHAEHFVDPALSFANGWNSVYSTMCSLPAELVAAAVVVQFWNETSSAVWITCFGVLLVISNLFFVRIYGELEFTFASLKIMLIVGLNIMASSDICHSQFC